MTDEQILADLLRREGGYVSHPQDPGGCTNFGITRLTLQDWRGRDVTCDDVRNLTETEAREIYRAKYLRPFDGLPPEIKPQVVDIAVNSGVLRARAMLATAQQQAGHRSLQTQLVIERLKHYAGIVKAHPARAVFLPGWINRACEYL